MSTIEPQAGRNTAATGTPNTDGGDQGRTPVAATGGGRATGAISKIVIPGGALLDDIVKRIAEALAPEWSVVHSWDSPNCTYERENVYDLDLTADRGTTDLIFHGGEFSVLLQRGRALADCSLTVTPLGDCPYRAEAGRLLLRVNAYVVSL